MLYKFRREFRLLYFSLTRYVTLQFFKLRVHISEELSTVLRRDITVHQGRGIRTGCRSTVVADPEITVVIGSYRLGCQHPSGHVLNACHFVMMCKGVAIHNIRDPCNESVMLQYHIVRNKSSNAMRVGVNRDQSRFEKLPNIAFQKESILGVPRVISGLHETPAAELRDIVTIWIHMEVSWRNDMARLHPWADPCVKTPCFTLACNNAGSYRDHNIPTKRDHNLAGFGWVDEF